MNCPNCGERIADLTASGHGNLREAGEHWQRDWREYDVALAGLAAKVADVAELKRMAEL